MMCVRGYYIIMKATSRNPNRPPHRPPLRARRTERLTLDLCTDLHSSRVSILGFALLVGHRAVYLFGTWLYES